MKNLPKEKRDKLILLCIGTLVVTPAASNGAIVVAASYTDARCKPPYADCIVARRRFVFVDSTSTTLPITRRTTVTVRSSR
ncbi:hypothetical protein HC776_01590 [bacterium]|nr:hypothetical protein [bacterium]